MISPAGRLLGAVLLAALSCAAARGGESFDRRIEGMLRRARRGEQPTEEDRGAAVRALRDWRLSERTAPRPGRGGETEALLRSIVSGRRPPAGLQATAGELRRRYLTIEGRAQRLREGPWGRGGRPRPGPRGASGSVRRPESAEYWFLFVTCLIILLGGLVVWVLLARFRRRPDHGAYYS